MPRTTVNTGFGYVPGGVGDGIKRQTLGPGGSRMGEVTEMNSEMFKTHGMGFDPMRTMPDTAMQNSFEK